jgi:hypothetical protein
MSLATASSFHRAPPVPARSPEVVLRAGAAPPGLMSVPIDEREHAIEVAAMLGDSVVVVAHCAAPHHRGAGWQPRWWFVIAGIAGLLAAGVFTWSLNVASSNASARIRWAEQQRPSHAFRPRLLGPVHDLVAVGSLALAVSALALGLLRSRQGRMHPRFRIGTAPGVELPLADAALPSFAVVDARAGKLIVRYPRDSLGELVIDQVATPLAALVPQGRARQSTDDAFELTMPQRGRIRLHCGAVTLLLSVVSLPRQHLPWMAGRSDSRTSVYLAGSMAAHLFAWVLLRSVPTDATVAAVDIAMVEQASMRTSSSAYEDERLEPSSPSNVGEGIATADQVSAAMMLPSGPRGQPEAEPLAGRTATTNRSDTSVLARDQIITDALQSTFVQSDAMRAINLRAITGGAAELSSALDATVAYGELRGDLVGWSYGTFGIARRDIGRGGDGEFDGVGGSGGYHTIGDGSRAGSQYGICGNDGACSGATSRWKRSGSVPHPEIGEPSCGAGGCGLDKAIIRRYIVRSMAKIRYCYEKQLLSDPELEGTVATTFVISPTGLVMDASAKGVNAAVSDCVSSVVQRIAFPRLRNSGVVQVHYPFTFRRS